MSKRTKMEGLTCSNCGFVNPSGITICKLCHRSEFDEAHLEGIPLRKIEEAYDKYLENADHPYSSPEDFPPLFPRRHSFKRQDSEALIPASDLPDGFKLWHTFRGHQDWISRLSWSQDGQYLASPSNDQTIRIWNVGARELCQTITQGLDPYTSISEPYELRHANRFHGISWSPNGEFLASASADKTVRLWNPRTGIEIRAMQGHTGMVLCVAWSPDGKWIASGSEDMTIRLWDAQDGKVAHTLKVPNDGKEAAFVQGLAWSPDSKHLTSATFDGWIRWWNPSTGREIMQLKAHSAVVFSVAWSPDGTTLASASGDKSVQISDPSTGSKITRLLGHNGAVCCVDYSHDGRLLASKSLDGTVRLWRCDNWECLYVLDEGISRWWACGLAFNPRLHLLATLGDDDTTIRVWQLNSARLLGLRGQILDELEDPFHLSSIFISYCSQDRPFAEKLASNLRMVGVKVWIDQGEIKVGDSLIEKIREGIDKVDYLAVVLTPASVNSEWVKREVEIAMNQEIEGRRVKVLPLLLKDCDLPWFLKGKRFADFRKDELYQRAFVELLDRFGIDDKSITLKYEKLIQSKQNSENSEPNPKGKPTS